ncbi:hypothetical protein ACFW53_03380 [Nocardiopsis dassonvillei]|uniref:hypothetical protein n=1 Tax=Nocardiopsis dassonvillei TaxID=2014 RepID=UPI003672AF5E
MELPLREWIAWALPEQGDLARNVMLVLRLGSERFPPRSRVGRSEVYQEHLVNADARLLLRITDAIVQLHPAWETVDRGAHRDVVAGIVELFASLAKLLDHGGSYVRFSLEERRLIRRVAPEADKAFQKVRAEAPEDAGRLLASAWVHAYSLDPDPDKSYSESVKAVEAVLNPLVVPNDPGPTLGKTLGILRQQTAGGTWRLVVGALGNQPQNIERFIGMVDLLWKNHDSRHAGGPNARAQEQHEAEAVLHLAILIVQWVNTHVLRRTESS